MGTNIESQDKVILINKAHERKKIFEFKIAFLTNTCLFIPINDSSDILINKERQPLLAAQRVKEKCNLPTRMWHEHTTWGLQVLNANHTANVISRSGIGYESKCDSVVHHLCGQSGSWLIADYKITRYVR